MSKSLPVYLIGAGAGIAPFRSFWQQLQRMASTETPKLTLIFGCRDKAMDQIYESEVAELRKKDVIHKLHLALSRERGVAKVRVSWCSFF